MVTGEACSPDYAQQTLSEADLSGDWLTVRDSAGDSCGVRLVSLIDDAAQHGPGGVRAVSLAAQQRANGRALPPPTICGAVVAPGTATVRDATAWLSYKGMLLLPLAGSTSDLVVVRM